MAATRSQRNAAITAASKAAAGGAANGGGPHNDSALDLIVDGLWDGTGDTPEASYEIGHRYGCFTRRCHATNPHGAGGSRYKLFAAKLLFNDSAERGRSRGGMPTVRPTAERTPSMTPSAPPTPPSLASSPRTARSCPRRPPATSRSTVSLRTPTRPTPSWPVSPADVPPTRRAARTSATPRPPTRSWTRASRNTATTDELHVRLRLPHRQHQAEAAGWGGNDNRDEKTGHVAGTFAAVPGAASYAAIAGCTSCHDQKDYGNTVYGNFTFPHGQVAYGGSNLTTDGVNPLPAQPYDPNTTANAPRSRIWAGYSGSMGTTLTYTAGTNQKAYDGQCLKCHRSGALGIGLTH